MKVKRSMCPNEKDDFRIVAAMDCLVPGIGEIIGGSQREEREELLLERIKEFNLNMDEYWWYLELRRYGTTKHAGYGLGFERLIMYLTGVNNIRDVIPFPRTTGTAEFKRIRDEELSLGDRPYERLSAHGRRCSPTVNSWRL